MTQDPIVVTGLGLITCIGLDLNESWASLVAGKSGARTITSFDTSKNYTKFACQIHDGFDDMARKYATKRLLRQTSRTCQGSYVAAKQMVQQYGIDFSTLNRKRIGVIIGSGAAVALGQADIEKESQDPYAVVKNMPNAVPARISLEFDLQGPSFVVSTACASGADAIGLAWQLIDSGRCDMVLTGGTEVMVNPYSIQGFNSAMALSERNDSPATASRPFEKNRSGFVMGEGAGVVILERASHARARGARVICQHRGYASTCEASDIMRPKEGGEGMAHTMRMALEYSSTRPEEVDYISAHGTSTGQNDRSETMAIKQVFGAHASKLAVSSQKSMVGHALGAAGAIEFVASAKIIEEGIITPTINYDEPDPELDLDYVPNVARKADVNVVTSNSFGFGGHNCVHVLSRY